ncbi:MAG: flippase-like domain-containing protein [Bacteroidia bacterium]|nr:flippase-like domain-containing protein [Bacteroidia bacterium]
MYYALPYKTKQFFFVLIKLTIVAGAAYFIYEKLITNGELDFLVFVDFLSKKDVFRPKSIIFLLFLTIFNWFFEILKWKELVGYIKKITFLESSKQSFGALTASLFTPNRIGEYGAKAIYFAQRFRKRILLLNLLGNISQMGMTVIFGIIGLFYFITTYDVTISYYRLSRFGMVILVVAVLFTFGISQNKFKIKGFSIERVFKFLQEIPIQKKVKILLYSCIRYAIFSFQFYFLLSLFNTELSYLQAMIGISSMYLLSSVVPTLFLFDVVIKGGVAVYIFGLMGINELLVLCIVTLMWTLNFVLPSIIGGYHVLNFNYLPENDE